MNALVSTHSRPKAAGIISRIERVLNRYVSTHSRPKAAGMPPSQFEKAIKVSTHSRPKAAGLLRPNTQGLKAGFNTQPPEGGWKTRRHFLFLCQVSTHSRPKAAGPEPNQQDDQQPVSTHSRPKAAGIGDLELDVAVLEFQHTAARRRLAFFRLVRSSSNCFNTQPPEGGWKFNGA